MSVLQILQTYALAGIPAGLAIGLALGLVADREDGWGGYGSFRRRSARLGHVASVMLPLLAGFYALALHAWPHSESVALWGAVLWVGGGAALVLTLFLAAWRPGFRFALPVPALALCGGAAALAFAVLSTGGGMS
jgi:hypothetical protein